jgi:hypothetical protein
MKQALDDAPWETVEQRFRLSTSRRHELTRLLAFTDAQQQVIARLRLRENQVEPLHRAVRAGELTVLHVDAILDQIRRKTQTTTGDPAQRPTVDTGAVARLVVQARRAAGVITTKSPQWFPPFHSRITAVLKDLKRLEPRFAELSERDQAQLTTDLIALLSAIHPLIEHLHQNREEDHGDSDEAEALLETQHGEADKDSETT